MAQYINGYPFKPFHLVTGGTKIIRIEQLNNPHGKYDYAADIFPQSYIIENGDLIFSWSATLKTIIWKYGRGVLNQHLFKVIPNSNISKEFLFYVLDSSIVKLSESTHGSTMKHIKKGDLDNYVAFCPKETVEQQHIADILTSCDEVIEQTEKAIEKYRSIKAGMLQDLFTRGVDASGRLRPKPEDAPELYKDSPLGKIPKEWDDPLALGTPSVAEINPAPSKREDYFIYIDLESVAEGCLLHENLIAKKNSPSRAQRTVFINDILFQLVRPYQRNNLLFEKKSPIQYVASTGYAQIRANISHTFLFYYMHSEAFLATVMTLCTGTGYPAITPSCLSKILVILPSINEQKEIARRLSAIDDKIALEKQVLDKYCSIKLGLMKKLLTPPEGALEA